jgi:pimeloyl-ACP methyl ester carboxylesterase
MSKLSFLSDYKRVFKEKTQKPILILLFMAALPFTSAMSQSNLPLWKTLPEVPALPASDERGLAAVNDVRLYYEIFNKRGKNTVILLHGGFGSSEVWGFEVPFLMKTHRVIVVDSRGHGRSTRSDQPFTYDLMASDVFKLLDQLNIRKVSIVGWSDGGIIGLILAMQHPKRVEKLFTFGANYNRSGYRNEVPDSASSAEFMKRAEDDYRRLSPTPGDFVGLKKALGKLYDKEPNLKAAEIRSIRIPTVIAYGQYEQFIKPEHLKELAQLIPNGKLVMIPNVAHSGPLQDPIKFHQAVAGFLKGGKLK